MRYFSSLAIVVSIGAIIFALMVPGAMQGRKHGNEAAVEAPPPKIATSHAMFREGDKDQDGNLDPGLIWHPVATPAIAGTTGDRYFTTNQAGCITYTTGGALALDLTSPGREAPTLTARSKQNTSTFAIDVDTASYTLARRHLREGDLPPRESVRLEEFVNYFTYQYPEPDSADPVAVALEAAPSPFQPGRHLLRVGLQARRIQERPPVQLTFLVDTSGSMQQPDRIVLVQRSLALLVENLRPCDSVAICTYAGDVREVLRPTGVEDKARILAAIESLTAGGSTAMASGIELAYRLAASRLVKGTVNRIVICTDGDANVGATSQEEIRAMVASYVEKGITLSVCGFGVGNYRDSLLEALADKGNGNYYYVDGVAQAKRIFQERLSGTLHVVARDTKVQVEMHDAVRSWRLVGYENRALANNQFRDDAVDAGEMGAGHSVTALYELELAPEAKGPVASVRIRHKRPDAGPKDPARESSFSLDASQVHDAFAVAAPDFRFAAAVVRFGEVLRGGASAAALAQVREAAAGAATTAEREELLELIGRAEALLRPGG